MLYIVNTDESKHMQHFTAVAGQGGVSFKYFICFSPGVSNLEVEPLQRVTNKSEGS